MTITATELKTKLGKYLSLTEKEDIIITRNGRRIAKLVREEDERLAALHSIRGILAGSELSAMSDGEIREFIRGERRKSYDCVD